MKVLIKVLDENEDEIDNGWREENAMQQWMEKRERWGEEEKGNFFNYIRKQYSFLIR